MKTIKQIREAYNIATDKDATEENRLSSLVESGLLDAKKLPALKEAFNKPIDNMTAQDKRMIVNLLEALISEAQSKKIIDTKDYFATPDPRVQSHGYPSAKEAPSVLLLKRKAIRVFPDGQKVALYYAQAIDKYVSIPYNEIGINEELDEGWADAARTAWNAVKRVGSKVGSIAATGISNFANNASQSTSTEDPTIPKFKPSDSKLKDKAPITGTEAEYEKEKEGHETRRLAAQNSRQLTAYRRQLAQQAMNEEEQGWKPKKTSIGDLALKKLKQAKSNQKQWKMGSDAARKNKTSDEDPYSNLSKATGLSNYNELPSEWLKHKTSDVLGKIGDPKKAEKATEVLGKVASSFGGSVLTGIADTGALADRGRYWDATKTAATDVVAPLAAGYLGGKVLQKIDKDAIAATATSGLSAVDKFLKTASGIPVKDVGTSPSSGFTTPKLKTPEAPKPSLPPSRPRKLPKTRADIVTGQRGTTSRVQTTLGGRGARDIRGPSGSVGFETPKLNIPEAPKPSTTIKPSEVTAKTSASGTNVVPIRKAPEGGATAQLKTSTTQTSAGPTSSIELRGGGAKPKPVSPEAPKPSAPTPTRRTPGRPSPKRPRRDAEPNWRPAPKKSPAVPEKLPDTQPVTPAPEAPKPVVSPPKKIPQRVYPDVAPTPAPQTPSPVVKPPKRAFPDVPAPAQTPLSPAPLPKKPKVQPARPPQSLPQAQPAQAQQQAQAQAQAQAQPPGPPGTQRPPPPRRRPPPPRRRPPDEEGTKKREPDEPVRPKTPFTPPSINRGAYTPLAAHLQARITMPGGKGPSAVASKISNLERKSFGLPESIEVNLDGNLFEINSKAANKVASLYESLNKKNKNEMLKMMNENADSLNKIISFAVRQ